MGLEKIVSYLTLYQHEIYVYWISCSLQVNRLCIIAHTPQMHDMFGDKKVIQKMKWVPTEYSVWVVL